MTGSARAWAGAALAVLVRPALWPTALRQALVLAPSGWWRRPPYLPLPDRAYLAFRMETMYGAGAPVPEPGDLVRYLRWCRNSRRSVR